MSDRADAIPQDGDGRVALRFERALPHPSDRVWRSLAGVASSLTALGAGAKAAQGWRRW